MPTSAADLITLQDIDLRRDSRRALIADIDTRLGETEELTAAREAFSNAESELERLRREQRILDDQVADLDAKIGPLETKLYDGSIHNAKELQVLQHEVEGMKEQRGLLDEQGLAFIETLEAANRALLEARQALADTEMYWAAEQEELQQDRAQAEADAAVLEAERTRWAEGMDAAALGLYESLRLKKQGRAVARIQRSTCDGCRLTLPTHIVQRVRTGLQLVQCPSCERILVGS